VDTETSTTSFEHRTVNSETLNTSLEYRIVDTNTFSPPLAFYPTSFQSVVLARSKVPVILATRTLEWRFHCIISLTAAFPRLV